MPSPEELKKRGIDPDSCHLYWLCDMPLKEWLKLSPEEKDKRGQAWNRRPPHYHGSIRSEMDENRMITLRDLQDLEDVEIFRERYK